MRVQPVEVLQDYGRVDAWPGHWNDPDMLEVGNGMSVNADKSHFSFWCMLAAPLMAGNDIRKMSKETNAILTNKEMIAVNQDPAGIEGFRYSKKDSMEVWVKPLSNEEWAVLFFNRSAKPMNVSFNWKEELIKDTIFNKELNAQQQTYKIKNLWANTSNGDTQKAFTAMLQSHDGVVLRVSK